MIRSALLSAFLVSTLLIGSANVAQETQTEEPQRYRIEVILFEHAGDQATPEDPGLPELPPLPPPEEDTLVGEEPAETPMESPEPEPAGEVVPFFEMAEGYALSDVAERLQRRSAYRVLLHKAWVQPGFERAAAQPVQLDRPDLIAATAALDPAVGRPARRDGLDLSAGGPGPDLAMPDRGQLIASAIFYRSRYLHLSLDARLEGNSMAEIRERRRMRIGELHYFDSPGLGAIATVSRYEPSGSDSLTP